MASKKSKIDKALLATLPQGCVLYLDGGCRPGYPSDPGKQYGGWGMHGYTYILDMPPEKPRLKKDVPTDIGYEDGTKIEWKQHVTPTGYIDGWGSLTGQDTNNSAEVYGLWQGLNKVKKLHEEHRVQNVQFLLDSQYAIKGLTEWLPKWEARNWIKPDTNQEIANASLWKQINQEYNELKSKINFKIDWVPGHSGNFGNEKADKWATLGVFVGRNGQLNDDHVIDSPIQKYDDPQVNINRLFQKNRLYFNGNEEPIKSRHGYFAYHCGSHGSDDTLVGMRMFDSVAYIVYTKEEQTLLEAVRQKHNQLLPNPLNDLCMMRLDTILLPRVYKQLEEVGTNALSLNLKGYEGTCTTEGMMATKVIKPSGLTFNLIDVHNAMAERLDDFLDGIGTVTDVTEVFYSKEIKLKKKKEIVKWVSNLDPSDIVVETDVNVAKGSTDKEDYRYPIRAKIGVDTPSKELINAIKDFEPKVSCLTWKISDEFFAYGFIFECGEDVMFWTGKDTATQLIWEHGRKKK